MKTKVSIIGAGHVGATTAFLMAQSGSFDVALLDLEDGMPAGKALDIRHAGAIVFSDAALRGGSDYEITAGSDIVVIAAGMARLPGMTRNDLLEPNAEIVAATVRSTMRYSENPIVIVVTNPIEAMCHVALRVSGLPAGRVLGMAGILDSARLCTLIADELQVSVRNVDAIVIGGHGDSMVPLLRFATVAGVSITDLLGAEKIQEIVERTRQAGNEIVARFKTGSAYYGPAAAIVEMARAIHRDEHQILPCPALLAGQYGIEGVYLGVPCVIGSRGLERIVELDLAVDELVQLRVSAEAVRDLRDRVAGFQ